MSTKNYKFETLQVHAGQETADSATGARAVPIYLTSSYVFKDSEQAANRFGLTDAGNIYTRLTNPTSAVFEERVAALEGGKAALSTASGAAAITYAIQNIVKSGDHIVSSKEIYGGSYNLFENTLADFGVETTFVSADAPEEFEGAIKENTKAIFIESIGNPNSTVADIDAIAKTAHKNGIPLIVDNTLATPYLLRPIEHGADVIVHSATKFLGGHGSSLGGIIVDSGNFDWKQNDKFPGLSQPNPSYHGVVFADAVPEVSYVTKIRATLLRDTGAVLSPIHSFTFLQGLETLSLRVERHVENTVKVIDFLASHPLVERVNHPKIKSHPSHSIYKKYFPNDASSIFTFDIKGDENTAKSFIDNLEIFSLLANVADVKSLVIHPASTTHSQLSHEQLLDSGILPNTIRLSIGIEHIDDILSDLKQAFEKLN